MRTALAVVLLAVLVMLGVPIASASSVEAAAMAWTPTPDACGPKVKKTRALGYWNCTFVDDFDGTALDRTKWVPATYFVIGTPELHACYRDDPANVNVADGVLNLTLVSLDAPAECSVAASPTRYMSGAVTTYRLFSQQYGRFEARIRTTATGAPGLHEAFWLWPDERFSKIDWPASGEIDISETFSVYPDISGSYLHYSADRYGLLYGVNAANCAANRGEWNTFDVEWSASRIETFVNGTSCLVNTSKDRAFRKRYIINLTQALSAADWNQLDETTPLPATMQVDYVKVWK